MNFQKVQNLLRSKRIAPLIDMVIPSSVTGVVRCPFCGQASFHVQQHPEGVGEWQHCFKCNRQGTPLTIAAEILGQNIAGAAQHLLESQGVRPPEELITEIVKREDDELQIWLFWQNSRRSLPYPSSAQVALLMKLGWAASERLLGKAALRGPGNYIGLCTKDEVHSVSALQFKRVVGDGLVLPYFSHVNQLVSLQLVTTTQQLLSVRNSNSLGFAFYSRDTFNQSHNVYLSSLTRLVGMLHTQADVQGVATLPIAAWQDTGTPISPYQGSSLIGHSVVLLEPTLTPSVVQLAIDYDAKICFLPHQTGDQFDLRRPTAADLASWCSATSVRSVLTDAARAALPLAAAVKVWRAKATQADIRLLLQASASYPDDVKSTICRLLSSSRRKIYYNQDTQNSPVIIETSNNPLSLVERNAAVYTQDGRKVFPGIVRVIGIVDRNGDPEYVGNVTTAEQTIPFKVRKSDLTYSWFYAFLSQKSVLSRHLRQVSIADRVSAEHLLSLAVHRKVPTCHVGVDKIGWDGKGFQYSKMRIENGRVTTTPYFLVEDNVGGPDFATVKTIRDMRSIYCQNSETAAQAWAWLTAISAIITAPAVGLQPISLIIESDKCTAELRCLLQQFRCRIRTKRFSSPSWFYYREVAGDKQRQYKMSPWMVCLQRNLSAQVNARSNAYRLSCNRLLPHAAELQNMLMPVMYYLQYFTANKPDKEFSDWQSWHSFSVRHIGKCFVSLQNPALQRKCRYMHLQHS